MSVEHKDIRLIAVSKHHVEQLRSDSPEQIIQGVRYILLAYEEAPPLNHDTVDLFVRDMRWWREQTRDLHETV